MTFAFFSLLNLLLFQLIFKFHSDTTAVEVISCNGSMIYEMSRCALKGLYVDELQYRNSYCPPILLSETPDGTLRFELNFGDCGMVQEVMIP